MPLEVVADLLAAAVAAKTPQKKPPPLTYADLLQQAPLTNAITTQGPAPFLDAFMTNFVKPARTLAGQSDAWITKMLADATGFVPPTGLNTTCPNSKTQNFDFKLGGDDGVKGTGWSGVLNEPVPIRDANDDFKSYVQGGGAWTPPTTVGEVLEWIKRFTALEGFFLRLRAAQDAASLARTSLSSALALYRTEGNLIMPMSAERFRKTLPPYEYNQLISIHNWLLIGPDMRWGMWSFPSDQKLDEKGNLVPSNNLVARTPETELIMKLTAFSDWCLAIVGFDNYVQHHLDNASDLETNKQMFTRFVQGNRRDIPGWQFNNLENPADRLVDVLNDLTILKWPAAVSSTERYMIAPEHPSKLVSLILGEALVYFQALGFRSGRTIRLVDHQLDYLAFHTQDTQIVDDPMNDLFTWVMASAAVGLKKPNRPLTGPMARYSAAHDSLQDGVLGANKIADSLPFDPVQRQKSLRPGGLTKSEKQKFRSGHVKVYEQLKAAAWWDDDQHLKDLAGFFLQAEIEDWGAFVKTNGKVTKADGFPLHRGNCARFARLLAFYGKLTT